MDVMFVLSQGYAHRGGSIQTKVSREMQPFGCKRPFAESLGEYRCRSLGIGILMPVEGAVSSIILETLQLTFALTISLDIIILNKLGISFIVPI